MRKLIPFSDDTKYGRSSMLDAETTAKILEEYRDRRGYLCRIISKFRITLPMARVLFTIASANVLLGKAYHNGTTDDAIQAELTAQQLVDIESAWIQIKPSLGFPNLALIPDSDRPLAALCMVCHSPMEAQEHVTRINCNHLYHLDCLERWLDVNHLCPCCRQPIERSEG